MFDLYRGMITLFFAIEALELIILGDCSFRIKIKIMVHLQYFIRD
jgi:hypothetical protein